MFLSPGHCPICEQVVAGAPERCPSCRSLIVLGPAWPTLDRSRVDEQAVQAGIARARQQIKASLQDGEAHYALALAYLNLGLHEQGLDELRRAAELLPEQHRIGYELALVYAASNQTVEALTALRQTLKLAPEQTIYRYLERYLVGMAAHAKQNAREAVRCWNEAFALDPEAAPARDALQQYVQANKARLVQPVAVSIPGLTPTQQEALALLNGRKGAATQRIPAPPPTPRPLGKTSMNLLHKYAPTRAIALEQMHATKVAAHRTAVEQYERQRLTLSAQNETALAAHEMRVAQIRADLPLLAELCAAAQEFELQQQQEAERRRHEQEERQRAAAAARASAPNVAVAVPATRPAKERHYLTTNGRYLQGLPTGKQGDTVTLTVSNQRLIFKHAALMGGWEQTVPMTELVEVADDPIKHTLSTEHRLRIAYRGQQGLLAHVLISGVKVDACVRKILQARNGS